jgi:hypothetical protein
VLLRAGAVVVLLVLAAAAAFVARSLLGVAAGEHPSPTAERILGGTERHWRTAATTVANARSAHAIAPALRLRTQALGQLERLMREGPAESRARAATLASVISVELAALDPELANERLRWAVASLQVAVRLDPHAEDPAFDLELLLQRAAQDERLGHTSPRSGGEAGVGGAPSSSPTTIGY